MKKLLPGALALAAFLSACGGDGGDQKAAPGGESGGTGCR